MKKYDELYFEQTIRRASGELIDELADDCPADGQLLGKYTFSPEFEAWVQTLIQCERKRAKGRRWRDKGRLAKKIGIRLSIALSVMVAICSLAAFSIPPVRVALSNFLIEQHEDFYSLTLDSQAQAEVTEKDVSGVTPYIPEGFKATSVTQNDIALFITYENQAGETIQFERHTGAVHMNVDSQGGLDEIAIGNQTGYYSYSHGQTTLFFHSDRFAYVISSQIGKRELIKIAENIQE